MVISSVHPGVLSCCQRSVQTNLDGVLSRLTRERSRRAGNGHSDFISQDIRLQGTLQQEGMWLD